MQKQHGINLTGQPMDRDRDMTRAKTTSLLDNQEEKGGVCRQANMNAIASHRPELHKRILSSREHDDVSAIAAGEPWAGISDHLTTVPPEAKGLVVFIGMGLGHGPLLLLRERPDIAQVAVVEPSLELFRAAMTEVDLQPLIASKRVLFFVGEISWEEVETSVSRVASLEDTHILRHLPSFQLRPELYGPVNDRAYMLLNQLNASGSTTRTCGALFMENRFSNFTLLRHAHSLDAIRDSFRGRPAVLVAAGPSLTRSIPHLRQVAGRCVLIAADSALAPLLDAGIIPDFVTSIDFLDLNFEKLAPFLDRDWPFSLVTLVKATPLVSKRFPARQIFFAFAEDQPQEWMIRALGIRTLAAGASSVAHLSLGLALVLGCEPIIFTGQDLSYTNAVGDHAQGTIIMRDDLPRDRELFLRPAVGGGSVTTDRQLLSLLKLFEDIIAAAPRHYVNGTAAGLRIAGTTEMPLSEAAAAYCHTPLSVPAVISKAIDSAPGPAVDLFASNGRKNLASVRETRKQLTAIISLTEQVSRDLARLPDKKGGYAKFSALPARLQKQLARFDQLNGAIDKSETTWTQVLELTFAMLSDNDQRLRRNERLREKAGYMAWLAAEIERINTLNIDRRKALESYAGNLESLLAHLDEEKTLLVKENATMARQMMMLHLRAGNYVLARRMLATLPESGYHDAMYYFLSGETRAGMLDFAGALADWRQALILDPSLNGRINALKQRFMEDWLGFVERYGNADGDGDNFPHLLPAWLGRVAEILADEAALPERLLSAWERHRGRIETWLADGQLQPAELTLNGWLAFSDTLPDVLVLRSNLFAARGEYEAAIEIMKKVIAKNPDQPAWLALLTRQLLQAQRFDEAVSALGRAIQLDIDNAVIWEEIGDMLFGDRDYDSAVFAYEKCFLALPARVDVLCKMGHCYLGSLQTEAAIAAYEAALLKNPANECARLGLARARGEAV